MTTAVSARIVKFIIAIFLLEKESLARWPMNIGWPKYYSLLQYTTNDPIDSRLPHAESEGEL